MSGQDVKWSASSIKCPYCRKTFPSRPAQPLTPLYEDSKGDVWGETSVLTFDYERYYPEAVNKSIRKESFVEGEQILEVCECVFRAAHEEKCKEINIPSGLARKDFRNFEVADDNRDAYRAGIEFSLSFSPGTVKSIGFTAPSVRVKRTWLRLSSARYLWIR